MSEEIDYGKLSQDVKRMVGAPDVLSRAATLAVLHKWEERLTAKRRNANLDRLGTRVADDVTALTAKVAALDESLTCLRLAIAEIEGMK